MRPNQPANAAWQALRSELFLVQRDEFGFILQSLLNCRAGLDTGDEGSQIPEVIQVDARTLVPQRCPHVCVCYGELFARQVRTAVGQLFVEHAVCREQLVRMKFDAFRRHQLAHQGDMLLRDFGSDEGQQLVHTCTFDRTVLRNQVCFRMLVSEVGRDGDGLGQRFLFTVENQRRHVEKRVDIREGRPVGGRLAEYVKVNQFRPQPDFVSDGLGGEGAGSLGDVEFHSSVFL